MSAPIRFAKDCSDLMWTWVIGNEDPRRVSEKASRFVNSVERVTLSALVFFGLRRLRSTVSLADFSWYIHIMVLTLPESRLACSAYLLLLSYMQLTTYTILQLNKGNPPVHWALYGIVHLTFGLGWLRSYDKNLNNLPFQAESELFGRFFPTISRHFLTGIRTGNQSMTQGLTYLVTGRGSTSTNARQSSVPNH